MSTAPEIDTSRVLLHHLRDRRLRGKVAIACRTADEGDVGVDRRLRSDWLKVDDATVGRESSHVPNALRAPTRGGQVVEVALACNVVNRMTEFGRPDSYRIGR